MANLIWLALFKAVLSNLTQKGLNESCQTNTIPMKMFSIQEWHECFDKVEIQISVSRKDAHQRQNYCNHFKMSLLHNLSRNNKLGIRFSETLIPLSNNRFNGIPPSYVTIIRK